MAEVKRVTNKEFAKDNVLFNNACTKVGIPSTSRQASKFRRKFGTAYKGKK